MSSATLASGDHPPLGAGPRARKDMVCTDPWSAVLAELTQPPAPPPTINVNRLPGVPTPVVSAGLPFTAELDTIRLVKERRVGNLRLFAVAFEDEHGVAHSWLIGVEEQPDGWRVAGSAGGGADPPRRGRPWVNLAAWWGRDRFCAGGQVLEAETARSVRLTTRDAVVLEDDCDAGIVLFLLHRTVELPVVLELRDDFGTTIASQLELDFERKRGVDRSPPEA